MNCEKCNNPLSLNAKFCGKCGEPVKGISPVEVSEKKNKPTIKCGNCGYVGEAQSNRSIGAQILAWLCLFGFWIITILYFATTKKYRCPKCKSTFVGIKDKNGNFVDQKTSVLKVIVYLVLGIALVGILSSVILASLNTARQKAQTITENDWAILTSSDGKFTVQLPRNPQYSPDETEDTIYGYSYMASEQNDKVYYVVKREDYSALTKQENIDLVNAESGAKNNFLKGLVDTTVEQYKLTDFSSQFVMSHGRNAVKFGGKITSDGQTLNLKGTIILDGSTAYYIVALSNEGYTSQFDRVNNSLQIN